MCQAGRRGSAPQVMCCLGCLAPTPRLANLLRNRVCLPAVLGQHSPSYGPLLSYCSGSATEQEKFFSRLGQNSWHTREVSVFALGPVLFFLAHHMQNLREHSVQQRG